MSENGRRGRKHDPRYAVASAVAFAVAAGYTVREKELPGGVMLDVEGYGELVTLYFARDSGTGFLRWSHGCVYYPNGRAATMRPWKDVRELLADAASR